MWWKSLRSFFLYFLCFGLFSGFPLDHAHAADTTGYDFTPMVVATYKNAALFKATRVPLKGEAYRLHCGQINADGTYSNLLTTATYTEQLDMLVGLPSGKKMSCEVIIVEDKMLKSIDDDYTVLGKSRAVEVQTPEQGEVLTIPFITIINDYGFSPEVVFVAGDSAALRGPALIPDEKYSYVCEQISGQGAFVATLTGEGSERSSRTLVVKDLKPQTSYYCLFKVASLTDTTFKGRSHAVSFTTTDAAALVPYATYEEKVLDNILTYPNPFPDTSLDTLEGKAAMELYRRDVIKGYDDKQFKGSRSVNRAELAKFLLLSTNTTLLGVTPTLPYSDLTAGAWYVPYIVTSSSYGVIGGYADHTFRPDRPVNTAEFLKMFTMAFHLDKNLPYSYTDVSSSSWFAQYAGVAQKYTLFPRRTGGQLQPGSYLTRNEVAVAIYQYLSKR